MSVIFDVALEWMFLIVGVVAIGAAAFSGIFWNYEKIENSIKENLSAYATEIYDYLDRMFKRRTLNECYTLILVPTLFLGFVGFVIGVGAGLFSGLALAFVFGFMGFKIPGNIVRTMFQKRIELFDKQLVDALNMMSNAIRSGLSFLQVVQVIEREMPKPCSEEFGMVLKENRVGIGLNDALLNMTKRMPSDDLFMIVNSVVTLSQQGGDLSEAFETIAETIRERQRVSDKIRTLAQAGITQAFILGSLPIVMLVLQYVIQPNYVVLLFTTPLGIAFLGLMVVMIAAGVLWMKKILTIDI